MTTNEQHDFQIASVADEACVCGRAPTDPVHFDAQHLREHPRMGESRWKSTDHHLLALRERAERAEQAHGSLRSAAEIRAEAARLRARARVYAARGRSDTAADYESDAQMLEWALGEGEARP